MIEISNRQQRLLAIFLQNGDDLSSSVVHQLFKKKGGVVSLVTIKRELSEMAARGMLIPAGAGRSAKYRLGPVGRLFCNIDAQAYCSIDPDKRYGQKTYNFDRMLLLLFVKTPQLLPRSLALM